jgi:hypothetical protein
MMSHPEPVLWLFGLWFVWVILFAVTIDRPLTRWVARRWFQGEPDYRPKHIRGRLYARERGIVRLQDDTSRMHWKSCALTLIHAVWALVAHLFALVVIIHLASWLAEHF